MGAILAEILSVENLFNQNLSAAFSRCSIVFDNLAEICDMDHITSSLSYRTSTLGISSSSVHYFCSHPVHTYAETKQSHHKTVLILAKLPQLP